MNIFEPRTMLEAVKSMPPVNTFLKNTFFKNPKTFPTAHVDVDFVKGSRRMAPFVHQKIGGKVVENTGFKTDTFKPELVAPDKITTADDILKRMPGETLYSGVSGQERAAIKLGEDLAELDEMITRREEWMCAQAIFTGKIPVKGEGLDYLIDFNFTNKETLSGTDLFSNKDSDPMAFLRQWHRRVQMTGHVNPDMCIMAHDVCSAFISHPKVKDVLDNRNIMLGIINPQQLPNGVTYVGRITELGLDIYQYNEWYLDDFTDPNNPIDAPMVPDGYLALLSSRARYSMLYASVVVADEDGSMMTVESARVPSSWLERRPPRRFVNISAKPLPVPHEVDSWFVAKVL